MPKNDSLSGSIATNIEYIKRDIGDIKNKIQNDYVTKEEFNPVRNLVYGFIVLICVAVIGALLALVIIRPVNTIQSVPIIQSK